MSKKPLFRSGEENEKVIRNPHADPDHHLDYYRFTWNFILADIRLCESILTFNRHVKTNLFILT